MNETIIQIIPAPSIVMGCRARGPLETWRRQFLTLNVALENLLA